MPSNEQNYHPVSGFTVAIVIAGPVNGAILLVSSILIMMCHFTNNGRKTVHQGSEDVQIYSKGCGSETLGCR
jgi:hypothetical protein